MLLAIASVPFLSVWSFLRGHDSLRSGGENTPKAMVIQGEYMFPGDYDEMMISREYEFFCAGSI
jgi:hypothetical protein